MANLRLCKILIFLVLYAGFAGFWGGLVPDNAYNASKLEDLLEAGALGLKVRTPTL